MQNVFNKASELEGSSSNDSKAALNCSRVLLNNSDDLGVTPFADNERDSMTSLSADVRQADDNPAVVPSRCIDSRSKRLVDSHQDEIPTVSDDFSPDVNCDANHSDADFCSRLVSSSNSLDIHQGTQPSVETDIMCSSDVEAVFDMSTACSDLGRNDELLTSLLDTYHSCPTIQPNGYDPPPRPIVTAGSKHLV